MPRRKLPLKACLKCKYLVELRAEICPNCGSKDFSEEWEGLVIIIDVDKSEIADVLNITKPGRYALKVR